MRALKTVTAVIFAISCLFSNLVQADMQSAEKAFEERDYRTAFDEFLKFAKIGNAKAQYYIGLMYYQGKGAATDIYEANAWFSLSRDGGDRNSIDMLRRLRKDLPSKRESKTYVKELESLYSKAALNQTLFPIIDMDDVEDPSLVPIKIENVKVDGINASGWALVSVQVSEVGKVRNAEIFHSYPEGVFDEAAIAAAQKWMFKPTEKNNEMVEVSDYLIKFEFRSANVMAHNSYLRSLNKFSDALKSRAGSGDAQAQYLLARLLGQSLLKPKTSDDIRTSTGWLLEAAKSGHPQARYELAQRLSQGLGCISDPVKASRWLEMSASAGYHAAQYDYAMQIFDSNPNEEQYGKAVNLLELAVEEDNQNANQQLGLVYATSIYDDYYFPFKSGLIAKNGMYEDETNPEYLAVMAASFVAQGSLSKGEEFLSKAYQSALDKGWPTKNLIKLSQTLELSLTAESKPTPDDIEAAPVAVSDGTIVTTGNTQAELEDEKSQADEQAVARKKSKGIRGRVSTKMKVMQESSLTAVARSQPEYPATAARNGIEGWVRLQFSVSEKGLVEDIEVVGSEPAKVFDRAATRALSKWIYEPVFENGEPIKATGMTVVLNFTL